MLFTHDTEVSLAETAALVNTYDSYDERDDLVTPADFEAFLARNPYSGEIRRTPDELEAVRALRPRLRELWTAADRDRAAGLVNAMLVETDAHPYLAKHDEWDWHLHVTRPEAPLADRIAAEAAMALLDLIRGDALDRLRICAADDCLDVYVDLSRNRSKRYCDVTCGNRANVIAYRQRQRTR